ncbi:putative carbonyl reductase [Aspergillus terreus]|uniref:Putative carbonyl reductase n=1 Tax=Aspergillus terreus TaxID=33178 RepID=A0A5M3Z2B5_ASPTE|nr:hypothetical protein ATETN484_0008007600 [Aspergillus terreus]GFF16403.1 putative carbonyl reductase [Aspergillus terreus]
MMSQPFLPPTPEGVNFAGQTVLITGGNSGLGLETARQCLTLQAKRVIITVRSEAKAQDALSTLRADPDVRGSNPDATFDAFILDLDDYQSAIDFVHKVKQEVAELDVLLCNAGTFNCYSQFLIVLELLPLLRATAATRKTPSRCTMVGSYSHADNTLADHPLPDGVSVVEHFDNPANYVKFKQYMNSKLVVHAFVQHLATLVPANEVIVNAPCPGVVATTLMKDFPLWLRAIIFVWHKTLGRSVEQGARALIYATRVAAEETHGKYLSNNEVASAASVLSGKDGQEFARRVWTDSCSEVRKVKPDIPIPE